MDGVGEPLRHYRVRVSQTDSLASNFVAGMLKGAMSGEPV